MVNTMYYHSYNLIDYYTIGKGKGMSKKVPQYTIYAGCHEYDTLADAEIAAKNMAERDKKDVGIYKAVSIAKQPVPDIQVVPYS